MRVDVVSAQQMFDAVNARIAQCDIFIAVAAVSDYRPTRTSEQKIKKSARNLTLELAPNPDILAHVAGLPNAPFCVGFAAESENVIGNAESKRRAKNVPLLVANRVQDALGADHSELVLIDDAGSQPLPRASKLALARQLITHIAQRFRAKSSSAR